jgi:hypothetical protein
MIAVSRYVPQSQAMVKTGSLMGHSFQVVEVVALRFYPLGMARQFDKEAA